MINRENYKLVKEFLQYQDEVMQRDPLTVNNLWSWLTHLLKWADEKPFSDAPDIRPVFPRYLLTVRRERNGQLLTAAGVERACVDARLFFGWLHESHVRIYGRLNAGWVQTIQPPNMGDEPRQEHQAITLEMVRKLVAVSADSYDMITRRDRAAAAFLYLSGMRAAAFCSLSIEGVDTESRTIKQYPRMGVKTKNRKAALTRLLEIPDLLAVVIEWDSYIRARLPISAPWYPVVERTIGLQVVSSKQPGKFRSRVLGRNFKSLFMRAGLPFLSPHKFRHGHAVYGLSHAKDVADLKAVSMNLMHASLGVTDSIYAILSDHDMQQRIARLGSDETGANKKAER